jgi:thiol:disulfide interchange protein
MRSRILGAVVLIGMLGLGCGQPGGDGSVSAPEARKPGSAKLAWASGWDDAFDRAKRDNRVVMVEFYADWCVWCQRMESTTFTDPGVVGLLADRAVPVKIDGEREGKILARKYRVDGYPTIVFLTADERELGRVPGYLAAEEFVQAISGWLPEPPTSGA